MNLIDVVILATLVGTGIGGWRLGLVARVFAWAGVITGLAIGVNFVPRVVTGLGGTTPDSRVGVALLFLFVGSIGQAFGLVLGLLVHRVFPISNPLPLWDRIAGAIAGTGGLLALTWLITPSLAVAEGWPAREIRSSKVVAVIQDIAPQQPTSFAAWGLAISEAPYPSALDPLATPPDPGDTPTTKLSPRVDATVRSSVVLVSGEACHQIQDGSGWVAGRGLVVTNAHVVAGERSTNVVDSSGTSRRAIVVAFDPVRDLAVLSVPDLRAAPLPLGEAGEGDDGVVYGHPGGGPLKAAPARIGAQITAVGTNIYRTSKSRRSVFVLAASLAPGDSGGALVDRSGAVVGVVFAIDPGRSGTVFALTADEVRPVLAKVSTKNLADTGACLVE